MPNGEIELQYGSEEEIILVPKGWKVYFEQGWSTDMPPGFLGKGMYKCAFEV